MKGAMGNHPTWSAPVAGLIAAASFFVSPAFGSGAIRFSGYLSGLVSDSAGRPQSGAIVQLLNKQDRLLQRAATDAEGNFSFDDLLPDLYAIRITFASFLPAGRDHIQVKPGMRSLLEVNLSRVFSSVQLVATTPAPNGLMSESWKWTLRADNSLRPILRLMPQIRNVSASDPARMGAAGEKSAVFSDSRGLLRISAADGAQTVGNYGEADLGTQFAFATSVYGDNRLAVSGNVGYAPMTGAPAAAIRTTFSRKLDPGIEPALSVTMRQFFVPLRMGQNVAANSPGESSMPLLRTLGFSVADKRQLSDSLSFEYGSEMDIISFVDRLQYFSPYAKLTYAIPRGKVDFTFTSGNPRPELGLSSSDANADMQRDLTAVSLFPRVTLRDNRARVQYGQDFEVGITQRFGSREFRVSGYREDVSNTAVTIANPVPGMFQGDVMPDLFSSSGLFNAGRFETLGYLASATQDLGENYKLTVMYGSLGVLSPVGGSTIASADDLRAALHSEHRGALDLRASGTIRATGTRFIASYEWTDYRSALPGPMFSTQSAQPEPGLNIVVHQPIPMFSGLPGKLEASAELRNLLAQGYLPISVAGQSILLVNTPRSFRGGLAFVF
jgi:hypothetical protein